MTVAENNAWYFDFFHRRVEFMRAHCLPSDDIAGYILWGACVDALAQIYAVCSGTRKGNREHFVAFLICLKPDLATISVPLLTHDLRRVADDGNARASALLQEAVLREYEEAVRVSRVWQSNDDRTATPRILSVAACEICHDQLWPTVRKNRYADLLYLQYRNPAVHGVELGLKTSTAVLPLPDAHEPHYMNYRYDASSSRGEAHQYRTRISFSLNYLINILGELAHEFEQRCVANKWTVPAYPTIGLS